MTVRARGFDRGVEREERSDHDHIVVLGGATWADYERLLQMRGERSVPRFAYLEGALEIMSPSANHEELKGVIGRLVEVYCLERDIDFRTLGSWTLKDQRRERGVEPDECYVFGPRRETERPDLAIEVVWTSGGLSKLDIYRRLGVREVWFWRRGALKAHVLQGEAYVEVAQSEVLPGIDLAQLAGFLDRPTTSEAMKAYRQALTS